MRRADPVGRLQTVDWVTIVAVTIAIWIASWALLAIAARRLPPGTLHDLAAIVPQCVTTVRRLRADDRVPRRAKLAVGLALIYALSPIDLMPEFLPIIGQLDDVIVVALALRYAARRVPADVLADAWPGEPRMLRRLVGHPDAPDG